MMKMYKTKHIASVDTLSRRADAIYWQTTGMSSTNWEYQLYDINIRHLPIHWLKYNVIIVACTVFTVIVVDLMFC